MRKWWHEKVFNVVCITDERNIDHIVEDICNSIFEA